MIVANDATFWHHFGFAPLGIFIPVDRAEILIWTVNKIRPGNWTSLVTELIWRGPKRLSIFVT